MSACPGIDGHCTGRRSGLRNNRSKSVCSDQRLCASCEALSLSDMNTATSSSVSAPVVPSDTAVDASAGGLVYLYDPVLCYVANVRNSSRRSDISHLVSTFLVLSQLRMQKNVCGITVLES